LPIITTSITRKRRCHKCYFGQRIEPEADAHHVTAMNLFGLHRRIAWIRSIAGRDGSIILGANFVTLAIRVISTIVLTRMLDSSAFGMVGIMTSVGIAVMFLSNIGIYSYVVRDERVHDPVFLDKVWSIRIVRGLLQAILVCLVAYPLTLFIGKPDAIWVILTAGLLMLLEAFSSLTAATATQTGLIGRLTILETTAAAFQTAISILFAYWWHSYVAIIAAIVLTTIIRELSYYFVFPNAWRKWNYDSAEARKLLHFGRFIAGSSLVEFLISQSDKFILAKLFPISVFGLYVLAASLAEIPNSIIANYVQRVIYPILTRARDYSQDELGKLLSVSGQKIRVLYMIACGGLIAGAPFTIELLYDNRYRGAAIFLRILAVATVFKLPVAITNEYLIAIGKVHHTLILNIIRLCALIIFGIAGYLSYGPIGVIVAFVATQITAYFYCVWAQWQAGHMRFMAELGYLGCVILGIAIGWPLNMVLLSLIRT
jgi:lipopolysaccharide exporter